VIVFGLPFSALMLVLSTRGTVATLIFTRVYLPTDEAFLASRPNEFGGNGQSENESRIARPF
jgi:hypothetical protein